MNDEQQLRPQVIRRLAELPPVAGDRMDAVLDATDQERAAAARELQDRAVELLQQAGALRPSVGVLDLGWRQAAALAAVLGTVGDVWRQPAYIGRPQSDVLKVVTPAEARWAVAVLRWGGLLPPEPAEEEGESER